MARETETAQACPKCGGPTWVECVRRCKREIAERLRVIDGTDPEPRAIHPHEWDERGHIPSWERGFTAGLSDAAAIVDGVMAQLNGAMDRGVAYACAVAIRKAAYDAENPRSFKPADDATKGEKT